MDFDKMDWPQIKVTGHIKENKAGGETISFYVNLGLFQLICIVNTPNDEQETVPCYVKFRIQPPREKKYVEEFVKD